MTTAVTPVLQPFLNQIVIAGQAKMRSMTLVLGLWLGLCWGTFGQTIHEPGGVRQTYNDPDLFNVRRFGAAGDGQTDDSAAIAWLLNMRRKPAARSHRIKVSGGGRDH
jgi:hypothetical protein